MFICVYVCVCMSEYVYIILYYLYKKKRPLGINENQSSHPRLCGDLRVRGTCEKIVVNPGTRECGVSPRISKRISWWGKEWTICQGERSRVDYPVQV